MPRSPFVVFTDVPELGNKGFADFSHDSRSLLDHVGLLDHGRTDGLYRISPTGRGLPAQLPRSMRGRSRPKVNRE